MTTVSRVASAIANAEYRLHLYHTVIKIFWHVWEISSSSSMTFSGLERNICFMMEQQCCIATDCKKLKIHYYQEVLKHKWNGKKKKIAREGDTESADQRIKSYKT